MDKKKVIFVKDIDEDFVSNSSLTKEQIEELSKLHDFEGKFKESILLPSFASSENIPVIILGTEGLEAPEDYLILGAIVSRYIDEDTELEFNGLKGKFDWEKFYLGILLQQYKFNEYNTVPKM